MKKYKILFLLAAVLFAVKLEAQQGVFQPGDYRDGVYDKENAVNRRYIPYTYLREGDVTWEKRVWRKLDMREKQNQTLYFPKTDVTSRVSLVQVISKNVFNGKIVAFADEEFIEPLEISKFRSLFVTAPDTVETPQYNENGDEIMVKVAKAVDSTWFYENFCSLDLKEDWFFDKQKSTLDVRILGLGFNFLPRGKEDAGCQNFFWVYFPACRPFFARNEVFNVKNDSERRTFEDVFWKRQFASVAFKESNVYDRKIEDYTRGIDALLESDRIKMDIFRTEHDLWQF